MLKLIVPAGELQLSVRAKFLEKKMSRETNQFTSCVNQTFWEPNGLYVNHTGQEI